MSEKSIYEIAVWGWAALGLVMLPILMRTTAPYGRHAPPKPGPTVPSWLGWLVMEAPSVLAFGVCFFVGGRPTSVAWALFGLWQLHYVNRAFIYPFRMRGGDKPMPLSIVGGAFFFTAVNGYLNGRWLTAFGHYPDSWATDPRFLVGVALFFAGFVINQQSDRILFGLRKPGETGYKVPTGGLYRFVTCPNYFGEIIEWCGWALASWSPAGLAFALWTIANLAPRARSHHRWYREKFADYPPERRALIPGVF